MAVKASQRIGGIIGLIGVTVLFAVGLPGSAADPFHDHIMVGGTTTDQLHALAHHLYHRAASSLPIPSRIDQVPAGRSSSAVSVLSVGRGEAAVFSLGGAAMAGPVRWIAPALVLAGPVVIPPVSWLTVMLPLSDPPPRWS